MQPVTLVLILLVLVEVGLAIGLIWLRRRNRVASGPILPRPIPARPPTPLAAPPPILAAPAPEAAPPPPAAPRTFTLDLSDAPAEDENEMDEARAVVPTAVVLTWHRAGEAPERWQVTVDMVSEDTYAFAGAARRMEVIQVVARRRVFHTLPFAHDRLLSAEDANAAAIPDIRTWLAALPAVGKGEGRPGAEPLAFSLPSLPQHPQPRQADAGGQGGDDRGQDQGDAGGGAGQEA